MAPRFFFKKLLLVVNFLLAGFLFLLPAAAAAQTDFVTCSGSLTDPCSACDLVAMMNTIIGWLMAVAVIIATMLIAYAGLKLATSRGDVTRRESAKAIFINTIVGLALLLLAWVLVDTIMKVLLDQEGEIGVWNEITCDPQPRVEPPTRVLFAEASFEDEDVPVTPFERQVSTGPYAPGDPTETTTDINNLDVTVNEGMDPIFDCVGGDGAAACSHMVQDDAVGRMQETLAGPFATLQENFGQPLVINDALAKDGTSREGSTPGSRHFHGDALDISIAGMSDADRIRLFEEAQAAGFTGFGFGNNILHIDRGTPRGWDYGNSTYGGVSTQSLIGRTR